VVRTLRCLLAVAVAALVLAAGTACIPIQPGEIGDARLDRLGRCETGTQAPDPPNYRAVSKSGTYRGAFQFDQSTWDSIASRHWPSAVGMDPAAAPAFLQRHLARKLWRERGPRPWPHCGPASR
jgi:hypothetical protein